MFERAVFLVVGTDLSASLHQFDHRCLPWGPDPRCSCHRHVHTLAYGLLPYGSVWREVMGTPSEAR